MNIFSNPLKVVNQLDVVGGQHVADLGAGSGAYSIALAERFKNNRDTKIFAVDVQQELLSRIESEAKNRDIDNIYTIWGNIEEPKGTRLRDASIDMAIIANTLFQIEDKQGVILEAKRILKPEGKLVIVDWSESFGNIGPKSEHVINVSTAKLLCTNAGFIFRKDLNVGEHHYGFVMLQN